MTNQRIATTKDQLDKSMSCICIVCRHMGEGLHTGEGMPHRQLHHHCPPQHGIFQLLKAGNIKHTAQFAAQQTETVSFQPTQVI